MSLRAKLLLVALTILVLPWAGWQFVREMEGLLRQGQAQALQASAEALARGVAARPGALPPAAPVLFVQRLAQPPRLDGDGGDWRRRDGEAATRRLFVGRSGRPRLALAVARADEALYVLAEVSPAPLQRVDARWPIAERHAHLLLHLATPSGPLTIRLANAVDGALVQALPDGEAAPVLIDGTWRTRGDGATVEMRLPLGYRIRGLGLEAVHVDAQGRRHVAGTGIEEPGASWPLLEADPALAAPLRQLAPPGTRVRLVDREGWVLARAGRLDATRREQVPAWRRALYEVLGIAGAGSEALPAEAADRARTDGAEVARALAGEAAVGWRQAPYGGGMLLSAAVPVTVDSVLRAAVVLEREDAEVLLLTDRALTGLVGTSLAALLAVGLVLLVFAGRLSARIRRLRDAAERALDREGRVRRFPQSRARDEIGDLSRSFATLLDEVAAYTDYLRTLASKLSHELNTPLAIVRTSLDNLDPVALPDDARPYLERARGGVDRLGAIVRAMSEVVRIEHAIAGADAEDFDLATLVRDCGEAYRPLLAPRTLEVEVPPAPLPFHGAPDLVAQALDKLVDNARSFAPADGWVRIALAVEGDAVRIAVANAGPPLPEAMRGRLFDSLVSVRDRSQRADGGAHLGLGLTIVRLVCELHRGHAEARDLADGSGVAVSMLLRPMTERRR
ncbi:ATP-binding protein [Coralloluteibacterium stylophorae]|uniref:histidine kinase n=1 Tax=Coralloluteibacterium stylophorae TaxID=1776034 RepID=A0A8J7VSB6_9GAMM|nr:ATP-binding protein [Coralloluteibacterium stylophorae]MBS7457862.1 histidine kinase [Coralloluteibacterium stylophorae]